MVYVVECLDCEEGNIELGSTKRVNEWISKHLIDEGNPTHTVSVYSERGECLADISEGDTFYGVFHHTPDFDTRDREGDSLPPGRLLPVGQGETTFGSLYSLAR